MKRNKTQKEDMQMKSKKKAEEIEIQVRDSLEISEHMLRYCGISGDIRLRLNTRNVN